MGEAANSSAEEMARLKAENEELKARIAKVDKRRKHGGFWRHFTTWLLVILACVFSVLGVLSSWVKTTALDTDTFVSTVAPLVSNDDVAKAISDMAVKKLFTQYDIETQIKSGLTQITDTVKRVAPDLPQPNIDLSIIASPITSGLENFASKTAQKILKSAVFYKVWSETLRLTHTAAVNIITGEEDKVVTSQDDTVVLNLAPLLEKVKVKLADAGLGFLNNVQVPQDFGQIKLFTSEQLGTIKGLVHLLETLSWVLPLLAFIFFLLAFLITEDKRKVLMGEGIGLAIAMLVVLVVLRVAHNELLGMIKVEANLAAANVIWSSILSGLRQAVFGLLALGIVVSAGAGLAGPSKWAIWTRKNVNDFFVNWRERREGKKGKTAFMTFMDNYAWWFRLGGLVISVLALLLLPHISGLAVIITVIVLLAYLALIELVR